MTGGAAGFRTGFCVQAALKESAAHKGIHRSSMQIGTLPRSRRMFAKGGRIVKSLEVKRLVDRRLPQFCEVLLRLHQLTAGVAIINLGAVGCVSCRMRKVRLRPVV